METGTSCPTHLFSAIKIIPEEKGQESARRGGAALEQRSRFSADQRSTVVVPASSRDSCQLSHRQGDFPMLIFLMLRHRLKYLDSYSGAGGPELGLWCFVTLCHTFLGLRDFSGGHTSTWQIQTSKFELIQNCSFHLPCTHFRQSGSFHSLIWTKWTNTKQRDARSTSFAQAGWTHVVLQVQRWCSMVISARMGNGWREVMQWVDGERALSSWSLCTAVSVSPATRGSSWEQLDPAGTVWIKAEWSAGVKDPLMDPLAQPRAGVVTQCLFLDPADTFNVTNPAPQWTGEIGRGSTLFCWFYFPLKVVIHSSSLTHSSLPRRSFLGAAWTIPKQCRSNWQGKSNWKVAPKKVIISLFAPSYCP